MIKFGRDWELLDEYIPTEFDWTVLTLNHIGTMYMNNVDGYMIWKTTNGRIYKSRI